MVVNFKSNLLNLQFLIICVATRMHKLPQKIRILLFLSVIILISIFQIGQFMKQGMVLHSLSASLLFARRVTIQMT